MKTIVDTVKDEALTCGLIGRRECTAVTVCTYCLQLLLKSRDAEWQLRVDAVFAMGRKGALEVARREGWEAGVRAAIHEMVDHGHAVSAGALSVRDALIAQGPK